VSRNLRRNADRPGAEAKHFLVAPNLKLFGAETCGPRRTSLAPGVRLTSKVLVAWGWGKVKKFLGVSDSRGVARSARESVAPAACRRFCVAREKVRAVDACAKCNCPGGYDEKSTPPDGWIERSEWSSVAARWHKNAGKVPALRVGGDRGRWRGVVDSSRGSRRRMCGARLDFGCGLINDPIRLQNCERCCECLKLPKN
jgi:hypothetical protein